MKGLDSLAGERSDRGVGRSILTLITGSMAAQLVTVAILPILTRLYSPSAFGSFAIFLSVVTLLSVVGTMRYEMAIVLPKAASEARAITRMGICVLALVSLVVLISGVAVLGVSYSFSGAWMWFLILAGPGVFLLGYNSFLSQWFTRSRSYGRISRNRVVQSFATAGAQVALAFVLPGEGVGLVSGLLIGQLVGAIFLTFADGAGASIFARSDWQRRGYLRRKYWRLPLLLMPHTLIDSFRLNGVNLLIGHFSVSVLGQYSQAWRLVQVPAGLIGSAVSQVYFPRLADAARATLFHTVRSSVIRTVVLGAVPFAGVFFLSPAAFPLILGPGWTEAGKFAQALVPALYANLVASPLSTIFIVLRKEHIGLMYSLFFTMLSLGALLLFRSDLLLGVWIMSLCQAIAFVVYVGMALWLVRPTALQDV
ncbi:oligosaccharide flippase family protein [Microbacterium sp. NPDC058345]|uniref:oligosaccharide flippase family protein n=1 Tax=Microbacterium sp. NPDC058345 TaxID=3346455 RepID=UPI0036512961